MSTKKQITANKANAKLSTGPKSERGKESSKNNALKHGLTGNKIIVGDEDPEEFDALRESLEIDLKVQGVLEKAQVGRIAAMLWRQPRISRMEAAVFRRTMEKVEGWERTELYHAVFPPGSEAPEGQELVDESESVDDEVDEHDQVLNQPISDEDGWQLARLKEISRPDSPELLRQKLIDQAFDEVLSDTRLDLVRRYDVKTANDLKNAINMLFSLQAARLEREQARAIDSISLDSHVKPKSKADKESG